jgi:hypothetical protein
MTSVIHWLRGSEFAAAAPVVETPSQGQVGRRRDRARMTTEYRIIFSMCLILFLWVAAFQRLSRTRLPSDRQTLQRQSVWAHAREMAHNCTSMAFQG